MCADDKLALEACVEKLGMGLELTAADLTLESSGGRGQPGPAGPARPGPTVPSGQGWA